MRILTGMSGGVDSSVAAALLIREGHDVQGATLVVDDRGFEAAEDARAVAGQLGIPHAVLDVRSRFRETVMDPFVAAYRSGTTPNPCVLCNAGLKFKALLEAAERSGCSRVATGHYAVSGRHPETGRLCLFRSGSGSKDQSYFLYRLSQEQLSAVIFPLGDRSKDEIRRIAGELGLNTAVGEALSGKKDSQDICFLPDGDLRGFLCSRSGNGLPDGMDRPGEILDADGQGIGTHGGLCGYTVGQRKGFDVRTTERLYVLSMDVPSNTIRVGPRSQAMMPAVTLTSPVYSGRERLRPGVRIRAKVRSAAEPAWGTAESMDPPGEGIRVEFDEPVFAPAPGQSCVLYEGDAVVAGGIILPPCGA